MEIAEFKAAITAILDTFGGALTEQALRENTRVCRDAIYADNLVHGGSIEDPFYNIVIVNGVAAFTFFESEFSIYVVSCDEATLINETEPLALSDTLECRRLLANNYSKHVPDIVVSRTLAEHWVEGS